MKKSLITNKTIQIYTTIIIVLAIAIFEFGYCNAEILNAKIANDNSNISYNFSACRIVVYIAIIILYFIFRKKFVEEAIEVSKNKYKRVFIYIASLSAIAITIVALMLCINKPIIFRGMSIGALTVLLGNLFIIYVSNNHLKNIVITLATFGIIFTISTDFNHALDEKKHFMTAFNVSFLNLDYRNNPITDNKIEKLPQLSDYTTINAFLKDAYVPETTNIVNVDDIPSTPANYIFILYIPSAIGIFLGRTLGGSIIDIYILGRLFNLIAYGALIYIALKLLPFKKNIFTVVLLMPMLLMLAGTYSIDGICTGLISIFIAYCLKLYKEAEVLTLKQFITLCAVFAITVILAKSMAYAATGLIIFILPLIKTLKKNKKYIPLIIGAITILLIVAVILVMYISKTQLKDDSRGTGHISSSEQIQFLITNPLSTINLAINHIKDTLLNYDWYEALHSGGFFTSDATCVMLPMMLFILYVSITEDEVNFKLKDKIIFIISFLGTIALTSIPLYLAFTEVGAMHIQGYQTRYIFPVISLLLICLSNNKFKSTKNANRNMNVAIASGVFLVLGLMQLIQV